MLEQCCDDDDGEERDSEGPWGRWWLRRMRRMGRQSRDCYGDDEESDGRSECGVGRVT